MKKYYGCWMHLSGSDNDILGPIIKKLSIKYASGDIFPPHVSVNGAAKLDIDVAIRSATLSIKGINKFKVKVDSIRYSEKWAKTLFIQLKKNRNLENISKKLNITFRKGKKPYILDPHISLLYKEGLDKKIKRKLAQKIIVPNVFTVTSMAVITPGNVNDWRDYKNWKIVYEKELK